MVHLPTVFQYNPMERYWLGNFNTYNGVAVNYLMRLNTNGSIDTSLVTGTGFDSEVRTILSSSCGIQTLGPTIDTYNGNPSNKITNLSKDGTFIG